MIKTVDGYTFEYLLQEAYISIFGITNIEDKQNPLAVVSYTNADTLGDIGPIGELIQSYRANDILDKYGLNINDYFNMPINIAKLLVSNVRSEKEDLDGIIKQTERQADRDWKKNMR